jgi:hypothetical protein
MTYSCSTDRDLPQNTVSIDVSVGKGHRKILNGEQSVARLYRRRSRHIERQEARRGYSSFQKKWTVISLENLKWGGTPQSPPSPIITTLS